MSTHLHDSFVILAGTREIPRRPCVHHLHFAIEATAKPSPLPFPDEKRKTENGQTHTSSWILQSWIDLNGPFWTSQETISSSTTQSTSLLRFDEQGIFEIYQKTKLIKRGQKAVAKFDEPKGTYENARIVYAYAAKSGHRIVETRFWSSRSAPTSATSRSTICCLSTTRSSWKRPSCSFLIEILSDSR